MNRVLTLWGLGLAGSIAVYASTSCSNLVNNSLTAISNCTWTTANSAVLTFSNFNLINNNGSGVVSTNQANWDLTFSDLGTSFRLTFNPNASPITADSTLAGTGGVYQFLLSYQVQETTPGSGGNGQLSSIAATLTSTNVIANGSVQFVKTFGGGGNVSLLNSAGSSTLAGSSSAGLPSAGPVTIFDTVNVNGGNNGASSATLNSFYNQINVTSGVPEPLTLSLVGAGLVGMGFRRRNRSVR